MVSSQVTVSEVEVSNRCLNLSLDDIHGQGTKGECSEN